MLKSIFVRAPLSDQLREKYRRRAVTVREGDTVKIVRGDFKNVEGKVQKVDVKEGRLFVEGVTRQKVKGGTTQLSVSASKVLVTGLSLDDKRRKSRLEQGGAS
jgi:large subunit ribosomal protein L24